MTQGLVRKVSDSLTALLLAAALCLGGILLARQVTESNLVRQSQIIRSVFSGEEDSPALAKVVTDPRGREALLKFAQGLANAYVSFELIPINEAATFSAVLESMGPVVEIEAFAYHRRNLTITGTAPDETGYQEFVRRLRGTGHFEGVSGHAYLTNENLFRFEIECVAAE